VAAYADARGGHVIHSTGQTFAEVQRERVPGGGCGVNRLTRIHARGAVSVATIQAAHVVSA
jgi:hypothetical protein